MIKIKSKTQKEFIDTGFGFPVHLQNVPMVKVQGLWTPNIDYNALAKEVLHALAHKTAPLTGNEVAFVRLHFEMTLQNFAKRFAVSHPAVLKWERSRSRPTKMNWTTEKDLRLFILTKLSVSSVEIASLYGKLHTPAADRPAAIQVNALEIAA